jgi:hypothetical protein
VLSVAPGQRLPAVVPLRVLLTHSAERFVPSQLVAWYADEIFVSTDPALNPTELARRSLGIVVLPATANIIAAAALGLASTPTQTAPQASPLPPMFFPSMNEVMWTKPTTQRYVAELREEGHVVVEPQWLPTFELWHRQNVIGPDHAGARAGHRADHRMAGEATQPGLFGGLAQPVT